MKRFAGHPLLPHVLLALGATGLAYSAWQHPYAVSADAVPTVLLVPGSAAQLREVIYTDRQARSTVSLRRTGPKDATTVEVTPLPEPPPAAPAAPAAVQRFPGNNQVMLLFEALLPLRASRTLAAQITAEQRQEFGLDEASANTLTLVYHAGSEVRTSLQIGKAASGSSETYAQLGDGSVVLLRPGLLTPLLHGAMGLQNRDVVPLGRDAFDRLVVTWEGATRTFVQRKAQNEGEYTFVLDTAQDVPLTTVGPWVDRLMHLRVMSQGGSLPTAPETVRISFMLGETQVLEVKLWQPAGETTGYTALVSNNSEPLSLYAPGAEALLRDKVAVIEDAAP